MLNFLFLLILLITIALLFREGLWTNILTLFFAVTSGIVATNYFEPLTRLLSEYVTFMDFNWDVVSFGLIFAVTFFLLRIVALKISPYRIRFERRVDRFGGAAVAAWTGWLAICIIAFVMHMAPMSRVYAFGSFNPEEPMFYGFAPDRLWLGFAQKLSNGGGWGANSADDQGNITSVFDAGGDFAIKYASRRQFLEKQVSPFYGLSEPE